MDFERLFRGDFPQPPRPRAPESFLNLSRWVLFAIVAFFLLSLANVTKSFLVDLLWFQSLGYGAVFTTRLVAELWLFVLGTLIIVAIYFPNLWLAQRIARRMGSPLFLWIEFIALRRMVAWSAIGLGLFLAVLFGSIFAEQWQQFLLLANAQPFGLTDPLDGLDVAWYVFKLPVYRFVEVWLVGFLVVLALALAGYYAVHLGLRGGTFRVPNSVWAHLSGLGGFLLLLLVYGTWLERYDLLFAQRGALVGAGWTDINVTLPILTIQIIAGIVAAALLFFNVFRRSVRLAAWALCSWLAIGLVLGGLVPSLVQRVFVEPNEFQQEEPYLRRHISLTRTAYGIEGITVRPHPGNFDVSAQLVSANPETTTNMRIWDHRPLKDTYQQIQAIRTYYQFDDIDIDRYFIGGQYRQVMLSARELAAELLPEEAKGWYNQRLQYTHGYGVAMSPVNEVSPEGLPILFLRDIPPQGVMEIKEPRVYFGERASSYVIINTQVDEFDYPSGDENKFTRYDGADGVPIGSFASRLLFAWEFEDINLLISGQLTPDSRVLFRRQIQERIRTIAPFLRLDSDPYLVVSEGRLFWVQDAYTTTSRFPYSQPSGRGFNYIRNSVKIVVDAYQGTTDFYINNDQDPIVLAYSGVFPTLFKPLSELPAGLRSHLRYPEDLFMVQADLYRTFHVSNPQVFYNREDQWALPTELFEANREQALEAYYVIMRLQGEARPEFLLILPFTPKDKQNTIAWMAARSDEPNRGQLFSFEFSKDKLVFGPRQIESRISQDTTIAQQFTLWRGIGAQIIRGNLLMIPLEDSLLYLEPIYIQATSGALPELKRVVLATGDRVVMDETLPRALARIVGEPPPSAPVAAPQPPAVAAPGDLPALAQQARQHYQEAQEKLRAGDWAGYGEALQRLSQVLERMIAVDGVPTPRP